MKAAVVSMTSTSFEPRKLGFYMHTRADDASLCSAAELDSTSHPPTCRVFPPSHFPSPSANVSPQSGPVSWQLVHLPVLWGAGFITVPQSWRVGRSGFRQLTGSKCPVALEGEFSGKKLPNRRDGAECRLPQQEPGRGGALSGLSLLLLTTGRRSDTGELSQSEWALS